MDAGDQPSVTIFSDGACSGNPGPGGWGTRLKYPDGRIVELGGFVADTTNNRMELTAALRGLERTGEVPSITLITDSEYLRKGITEWIHGWKRRGWITASKKPVLNQDLWRQLDRLNGPHVTWEYTRGHAGDPDNERCDDIAQGFSRGESPALSTE
ncbi:MAG: ribonuclease HI [Gemmatimonadetes bacterium]|nr:ribonuclease HI [Gemmatimonadota bacterium]